MVRTFYRIFPARTNLKLPKFLTPKRVKKVIMNLDSFKASDPDCIPVAVLKSCESELSYILGNWWSLYIRMLGERSAAKNYCPVSLFLLVKSLKNL